LRNEGPNEKIDQNFDQPRLFIEYAIQQLYPIALQAEKDMLNSSSSQIVGAEWWIQLKDEKSGIGFHYDKDEGMASDQMKMRFYSVLLFQHISYCSFNLALYIYHFSHPLFSTVTYLKDFGAPTMILNQYTPGFQLFSILFAFGLC